MILVPPKSEIFFGAFSNCLFANIAIAIVITLIDRAITIEEAVQKRSQELM